MIPLFELSYDTGKVIIGIQLQSTGWFVCAELRLLATSQSRGPYQREAQARAAAKVICRDVVKALQLIGFHPEVKEIPLCTTS